jgi:hypothetical protein
MIEAMVTSDHVFKRTNLQTVTTFLMRVGPALDGMMEPGPSRYLTDLLKVFKNDPNMKNADQIQIIDSLCRNMGRSGTEGPSVTSSDDGDDYSDNHEYEQEESNSYDLI